MIERTIIEAITRIFAAKLREYYLRGIRDASVEQADGQMPSFLEEFDAGNFDEAYDRHVWLKVARDILG